MSDLNVSLVLSLVDRMTAPLRAANLQWKTMRETVKSVQRLEGVGKWGRKLSDAGTKTAAVGAGMTYLGKQMRDQARNLVEPFFGLEESLAALRTVAPGTFGSIEADMAEATKAARAWSLEHRDSAEAFARGNYMMVSSGLDMRQAIAGTQTALTVARATMGEAGGTASALATFYANFGDRAADTTVEMTRLGDVMARTQQLFKFANLGQLTEGMKYATAASKTFRVDEYQTLAALGALNDAGIEGGMAGTSYAAVLRQMNKASKDLGFDVVRTADGNMDFIATVRSIRAQFGDRLGLPRVQQAFQDAFGEEGMKGIMSLLDKVPRMEGALGDLRGSLGTAAKAQRMMEAGGGASWDMARNAVNDLKVTLGEQLAPMLVTVVGYVKDVALWFRGFADAHPTLVRLAGAVFGLVTAFVSIAGPVLIAKGLIWKTFGGALSLASNLGLQWLWLKLVGTGFAASLKAGVVASLASVKAGFLASLGPAWAFTAALLANPITWIAVGVGVLVGWIGLLIFKWQQMTAWWGRASSTARVFAGILVWMLGPIAWLALGARWVVANWEKVGAIWGWVRDTFSGILGWLAALPARFFQAGAGLLRALWQGMKSVGGKVWDFVSGLLGKVGEYLPHSDAKRGPLSHLTRSGRAFVQTWTDGMRLAAPRLPQVGEELAERLRLEAPDFEPLVVKYPAIAAGAGREGKGKTIRIQSLQMTVQADSVKSRDDFVALVSGLALEEG
ncbi:MAG: phage tail tape measure protein [Deltaproteobacteria bacterium]|nr:phage tail tape measure protein [Deltaproteobacteria bacterium]